MTFDPFIWKYTGKAVDYDGKYGPQCMDLYRQYVKEVLGFPQSKPVPSAKDVWDTYLPDFYERISNSPSGVPQKGDIVIWGGNYGPHGHIAIFIQGNTKQFTSFDQNDPLGSLCHEQLHTYKGVLGWLRPKYATIEPDMPTWLTSLLRDDLGLDITKSEGDVRGKVGEIKNAVQKYDEVNKRLKVLEEDYAHASGEVAELREKLDLSDEARTRIETEIQDLKKQVTNRDIQITDLTEKLESLTAQFDPESVVAVKREEYEALISTDPLRRFSRLRLLVYVFTGK